MAIGTTAAGKVIGILQSENGLEAAIANLSQGSTTELANIAAGSLVLQNVALEIAERAKGPKYPAVYVYCEKLSNTLREKFRKFSGKARMVVEIRVSHDRMEGVSEQLHWYVDAVGDVLDMNRGDWGGGVFYAGGYEAVFGAIKHGGRNFIQVAKVAFDLDVSTN